MGPGQNTVDALWTDTYPTIQMKVSAERLVECTVSIERCAWDGDVPIVQGDHDGVILVVVVVVVAPSSRILVVSVMIAQVWFFLLHFQIEKRNPLGLVVSGGLGGGGWCQCVAKLKMGVVVVLLLLCRNDKAVRSEEGTCIVKNEE